MPEPFKNLYSVEFYASFSQEIKTFLPEFNEVLFTKSIFDSDWQIKELKDRMRHTTKVLHEFMPKDFAETASLLSNFSIHLRNSGFRKYGLQYMFIPDYIETYGIEHFEASTKAFEIVTQFTSCEFAVRPFLVKHQTEMVEKMLSWTKHESEHVRRLASEGSRPRLPWAMALPEFKKDPNPILPILENLKQDSSEYVRRSVANNLNDIIKDHPDVVLGIMKKWKGLGKETDYILKHGCRTLLKSGHVEALAHFGLVANEAILVSDFQILTPNVKVRESLTFSFSIQNQSEKTLKIRLEYGLYYRKANGALSRKVFKISEKEYLAAEKTKIIRNQSFRIITTKVFYEGEHALSLIVNGE